MAHAGGRPRIWQTPDALQKDIDRYFRAITRMIPVTEDDGSPVYDMDGNPAEKLDWIDTPTMSGLALAIGVDRSSLQNYAIVDEFFPVVKKARDTITRYYEKRLDERPQAAGTIFWLKQGPDGWKDAQTLDISHSVALPSYDVSRMTIDQKRALYDLLLMASRDPDADIDIPQITQD